MKNIFNLVLSIILIGYFSPTFSQWQKNIIDENMIAPNISVDAADLDGDTKLDLLVTNGGGSKIILYLNDFPEWDINIIANDRAPFAFTGDIDGDDTLDVLACLYFENKMVWYENNHPAWTQHMIDENTNWNDYVELVDLNNDNKLDVVSAVSSAYYNHIGDIVWYENNLTNPSSPWYKHIIDSNITGCGYINVSDIDSDGLYDVVAAMDRENDVVWYKNENNGLTWTKYIIDENLTHAWIVNNGDVNDDGKMDLVATAGGPYYNDGDVVWYENDLPIWTKHVIDTDLPGANFVAVADVDGDGAMDVIADGFTADDVVWYENNNLTWTKHIIDANLDGPRIFALADLDGDEIQDLIVPGVNKVVWYKNPYTNIAFGQSLEVYPKYIKPGGDTLNIVANISNPENHPVVVYTLINGDQNTFEDSLELFDDGLHGDGEPSDNIFGENKWLSGLEEQNYTLGLYANDQTFGTILPTIKNHFTTAGPAIVDNYIFVTDTIPNPGDEIILKLELLNSGNSAMLINVEGYLSCIDTSLAKVTQNFNPSYGNILAGVSSITTGGYRVKIADNCPADTAFLIQIEISSNGYFFWKDTFSIDILTDINDQVAILPKEFALDQNYPNPFNPSTTIKYSIPKFSNVQLKIFDVLGNEILVLVNEEKLIGSYEVEFDASKISSGVYFYLLKAGEFVETKKMILLK